MKNYKNYIKLVLIVLLFLFSSIFKLIPILFFKIKPGTPFNDSLISLMGNSVVCFLLCILYRDTLINDFKNFKNNPLSFVEIGIKYWFIGLSIMVFSNAIISMILGGAIATNEENVRGLLRNSPIITLLITSITAPIIEELVFRKTFRDAFSNKWVFVLSSGIIFGSLHVLLVLHSLGELLYLIPYCSLGIAFSYMYYKSDNIYTSIFVHMLHNSILSILSLISLGVILW